MTNIVLNMSFFGAPPGNTSSYSTANSSPTSVATSTDTNRLRTSPGGASEVASSNMSRARGRMPGVDKDDSGEINVIILRDVLQDNSMVGGFLGWVSVSAQTVCRWYPGQGRCDLGQRKGCGKRSRKAGQGQVQWTGDDLDSYDKCILQLVIELEKLTSAQKEEQSSKRPKSWTRLNTWQ